MTGDSKNERYFFISVVVLKVKSVVTFLHAFSLAWRNFHRFALSYSDWLIALFAFVEIGWIDNRPRPLNSN